MKDQSIRESIVESLPIDKERKRVLNRRLDKLKRDPKDFLRSSYSKRSAQLISKTPIKYKGSNNFTVVSAVYNVGKYLDDYFDSLVNQSLSFKRHIQLILVDDGSTDNSAEIIKKWQKKYPKNITYLYKENGGQSSARNLGMTYIKTDWVTFIDPDDFVDKRYFKAVSDEIDKDIFVNMIVANLKFYMEDDDIIIDKHSLKFRFKNKVEKFNNLDLKDFINLSAAATIFKKEYIVDSNIKFDERIKPNFEDGKFIADYLLMSTGKVIFLKEPIYFYRKRSDKSSTVDNSWIDERKYYDVLKYGYIPMLKTYKEALGKVPIHIQRTVLYDITWYVRSLVNSPEKISFLTVDKKNEFYSLVMDIFNYIETDLIFNFNLAGIWYAMKVGMIGSFKKEQYHKSIVYVENLDREKKQILFSYFDCFNTPYSFRLDKNESIPSYQKKIIHEFFDRPFVTEYRCWVDYEDEDSLISVLTNGQPSAISLKKMKHVNSLTVRDIIRAYQPSLKYSTDDSWLLMDKVTQGDDNAEHLYRYLMQNHPEKNCYFALSKSSADWDRLNKEGFKLLEFGTEKFEYHLYKASKVISSYFDEYISDYFKDKYEYSKKFVFLQHGVIHTDLSKWLNDKPNMLCFITTTKDEYQAIISDDSHYQVGLKEVVLTGLPRHDQLLTNNKLDSNIILIMPTWRASVVGEIIGNSNVRKINEEFMETEYAQHWHDLLHNETLEKLAEKYDYKIVFAPHANVAPYINQLNVPSYIATWQASTANNSMQQLFQESKLMITDYSSVAFEMGLLEKTVLYYQFDEENFFSGKHTVQRGCFSYENDGFGPVVTEEEALLIELEKILTNDGKPLEPYANRIQNTFAYRDTNNCERVYEAILDLDRPDTSVTPVKKIMEYAEKAITHEAWDLALERIDNALQHSAITPTQVEEIARIKESVLQTGYQDEPVKLANILWHEKRLQEALDTLKQIDDTEASDELLRLRVRLAILNNDFMLARDSQKLLLENYNETCTIEDWQFYTQLAHV